MQAISGEITSQALNNNFSELDSNKLGKDELFFLDVLNYGADRDGFQDSAASIQAALNAADGKNAVVIPWGTYLLNSVIKVKSGTTLYIFGKLKRNANINALILNDSDGTVGGYDASKNISIIGMADGEIDMNGGSFATDSTGIGFGHAENVKIQNLKFTGMYNWHYVELNAVKNAIISGNTFDGYALSTGTEMVQLDLMKDSTVFPWFGPYDNTPCENITIERNVFRNGVQGIGSHSNTAGKFHRNIKIDNNEFTNFSKEAIKTLSYSELVITRNKITDCQTGIKLQSGNSTDRPNRINISKNILTGINKNSESRGIHVDINHDRGVIEGNVLEYIGKHGIGVDKGNSWMIRDNHVLYCDQAGIWSYGSANVTIANNVARLNNVGAYTGKADIMLGATGVADETTNNIMTGNIADVANVSQTKNSGLMNNIIGSLTESANTNLKKSSNLVAGVWST